MFKVSFQPIGCWCIPDQALYRLSFYLWSRSVCAGVRVCVRAHTPCDNRTLAEPGTLQCNT